MNKGILYQEGQLDVLPYYTAVAPYLKKFLHNKLLATKIYLPKGQFFLKRGSLYEPLFIDDFSVINKQFFQLRNHHLAEVKEHLSNKQQSIWSYFPPRKLAAFFYATNGEGRNNPIERIYFDIDRKGIPAEIAQRVAASLIEQIEDDVAFKKLLRKFTILPLWTGSSFHVYLLLRKQVSHAFYEQYISYKKDIPLESFTGRWIAAIKQELKIPLQGGHEKIKNHITVDPSQTPSGKLARAPFSLHMKNDHEVDGIAVPLTVDALRERNLIQHLEALTPDIVLKHLAFYTKLLQ